MGKPQPVNLSVSRKTTADAETLFNLITDVTNMPRWSPETVDAQWVGTTDTVAVGAKFKGTNKLGKNTWSTKPTVTRLDVNRFFEFEVPGRTGPTWSYRFQPTRDGGTEVTESVHQTKPSPALIRFFQRRAGVTDRSANLHANITTTLERLCSEAERLSATTTPTTASCN